jgi:hypothetical protein
MGLKYKDETKVQICNIVNEKLMREEVEGRLRGERSMEVAPTRS